MSFSAPHKVARPAARYRPGKAPTQSGVYNDHDDDDDDADDSADEGGSAGKLLQHQLRTKTQEGVSLEAITDFKSFNTRSDTQRRTAGVIVNIGSSTQTGPSSSSLKPNVREADLSSDEYETDTDTEGETGEAKPPITSESKPSRPQHAESESEYETDSEDSSSEEEQIKPMFKPIFVPKSQRQKAGILDPTGDAVKYSAQANAPPGIAEDLETKAEAEAQKRRLESQRLAGERIKLELLEKQADEAKPDLDDTDDLDPEGEFAAWRLRELQRIKRQWEAEIQREEEEEERRARQGLTEEEKLKMDLTRAEETRRKKDQERGKMGFMQKYYHKGAFFQDMDILKKRDYLEQTESAVDVSKLPKVMQVRDYGKKGRSKYTHLADEDTTRKPDSRPVSGQGSAAAGPSSSSASGCFHCGSPDHRKKDCPVLTAEKETERENRRRQYQQDRRIPTDDRERGRAGDDDRAPLWSRDAAARQLPRTDKIWSDRRSLSPPARALRSLEHSQDTGGSGTGSRHPTGSDRQWDISADDRDRDHQHDRYLPLRDGGLHVDHRRNSQRRHDSHRPTASSEHSRSDSRAMADEEQRQIAAGGRGGNIRKMDRWAQRKQAEAEAEAAVTGAVVRQGETKRSD